MTLYILYSNTDMCVIIRCLPIISDSDIIDMWNNLIWPSDQGLIKLIICSFNIVAYAICEIDHKILSVYAGCEVWGISGEMCMLDARFGVYRGKCVCWMRGLGYIGGNVYAGCEVWGISGEMCMLDARFGVYRGKYTRVYTVFHILSNIFIYHRWWRNN